MVKDIFLFYGSFKTYPNYLLDRFEENQIEIIFFNTYSLEKLLNKKFITKKIFDFYVNRRITSILEKNKIQVFFSFSMLNLTEEIFFVLEKKNILSVNFHGDDLYNPRFIKYLNQSLIKRFDFHITGRKNRLNFYNNLCKKEVIIINWFHIEKDNQILSKNHKISFVGSYSNKRKKFLESIEDQKNLNVFGWGWNHSSIIKNYNHHLEHNEMNNIFKRSLINLNFLTEENFDLYNQRNFEIPSQYAFQLSERSVYLEEIFKENFNIAFYSSEDELNDKLRYFSKDTKSRDKIIKNSWNLINSDIYSLDYQIKLIVQKLKYYI